MLQAIRTLWQWWHKKERDEAETPEPDAPFFPEPVTIPIEDSIDLHTFAPHETASVVESYLEQAAAQGYTEVRIIHGKGKGVQKRVVAGVLSRHVNVLRFEQAPPLRGGWGATIAWLRQNDSRS